MIPEGWRRTYIGSIAEVASGGTPDRTAKAFWNGGIPWVTTGEVNFSVIYDSRERITEAGLNAIGGNVLPENTILLAMYGQGMTRGRAAILGVEACTNQNCAAIRVGPDNHYVFVYYSLAYNYLRIRGSSNTGQQPHLNAELVRELQILLSPLPEQRKIAAILSTWDEAITLTERMIDALKRRKQALMQRLLTGEVRFKEFKGEEWCTVQIGEVATVRRGASPRPINDPKWFAETGRAWVRIADVTASPTRFLTEASQYLSPLGEEFSVKVEVGDLIMSIAATIGVPKIMNIPACIHDGFVTFGGYESRVNREFLYHFLGFKTSQLANSGQPGTQKNINSELVRQIEIPLLGLEEQAKIAEVLNQGDEISVVVGQYLNKLQIEKRGLMQQLLTGAIRVQPDE